MFTFHFPGNMCNIFICLIALCVFEVSFKGFGLLFKQVVFSYCFFFFFLRVLCIFWIVVLYHTSITNILSQSVAYPFILLIVSFLEQRSLALTKSSILIFPFIDCLYVVSQKSSPNPKLIEFSPMLSSRSFIDLHFKFRSVINV